MRVSSLGAALALVAPAIAQVQVIESPTERPFIRGEMDVVPGGARSGGYGWLSLRLTNEASGPRRIEIDLTTAWWNRHDYAAHHTLDLAPGETARVELALPTYERAQGVLQITHAESGDRTVHSVAISADQNGPAILFVRDEQDAWWQTWFTAVAEPLNPARSRKPVAHLGQFLNRSAADLPTHWQWLTGFDLIAVDGGATDLDRERQQVLRDYLDAGGHLLITDAERLPAGPLAHLATGELPWRDGRSGFGAWFALRAGASPDDATSTGDALSRWLEPLFTASFFPVETAIAGPAPGPLHETWQIVGLGEAPIRLFFVFILMFAIAIGPVNHFIAHRRRQPLMLLVTVPAIGIGSTIALLAFGLVSEGLHTRGSIKSITQLDQRDHHAINVAGRTLYAGLSPSQLEPLPGSYLYSTAFRRKGYRRDRPHLQRIDHGRGNAVSGSALPSRTPTHFATVTHTTSRARLRFRRIDADRFEVLSDGEMVPLAQDGSVWLRAPDERLYASGDDGVLRPADSDRLVRVMKELTDPADKPADMLGIATLAPGQYLALVRNDPAIDTLGLDVDYGNQTMVVIGTLGAEDILE